VVTLSDDANVRLEFLRDGDVVASTPTEPAEEGRARLAPPLPELSPGRYAVRVVAEDGVDAVTTEALPVRVAAPAPAPSPSPTTTTAAAPPRAEDRGFPVTATSVAVGVVVILLLLAFGRRKGLHRQP
jgi:hypothetical protein